MTSPTSSHLDLNLAPPGQGNFTLNSPTAWRPTFTTSYGHVTVNDSVMVTGVVAVGVAKNISTPTDKRNLARRSDNSAMEESMAFSVRAAASVADLSHRLSARTREVEELSSQVVIIQRLLQDTRQLVTSLKDENASLKEENASLHKLVTNYSKEMKAKLDALQSSGERLEDGQHWMEVEVESMKKKFKA